jgi:hypothetical protein
MPQVRAQVRLPRDGGKPEDDVVNVWHFTMGGTIQDHAGALVDRLDNFYTAIQQYMSRTLSGVIDVKIFDLASASPRPIIHQEVESFVPDATAQPLPAEIATKVTLYGLDTSNVVPVEYRRGGCYIGPINNNCLGSNAEGAADRYLHPEWLTLLANSIATLRGAPTGDAPRLAIFSPTWNKGRGATSGGQPGGRGPKPAVESHSIGLSTFTVYKGHIDNAVDIQRRRGADATTRQQITFF